MSIPLIKVKNLCKIYESEGVETRALCGVSFSIAKGELVAIMGPSGSGKSTLMHILGLLDRATSGEYLLEGKDITKLSDDELAVLRNEKIGFVFQAFNLLPRTTVLENVKLPLVYSHKDVRRPIGCRTSLKNDWMTERAKEVLESVGLGHRLNYFTNQISGGEKQRVAIARALVNNPSVIFADEPTGNLDSKSGMQIMEILQKLNDAGNTIILVTHESTTTRYVKRIMTIRDGAIASDEIVNHRRKAGDGELK